MSEPALDTLMLHDYLARWKAGDPGAMNDLVAMCHDRLNRLARNMLRSFPNVSGWEQAEDVLQNSLLKLIHTLETITPKTSRDFFNLAAVHIRRELLDLARHYRRRKMASLNLDSGTDSRPGIGHPATPGQPEDFEVWCRFHEAVDELEADEREVIGLVFYHGWTQRKIADLFHVDERTIRRRWTAACQKLRAKVDDNNMDA